MQTPPPLHSRIDLACEQLETAITIFSTDGSYISALTLAGAAEEIFGYEIKNRGQTNAVTRRYEQRVRAHAIAKFKPPSFSQLKEKMNYARNAAKHIADKDDKRYVYDEFFRADPKESAKSMILRAMQNQEILGLPRSPEARRFYAWYLSTIYSGE